MSEETPTHGNGFTTKDSIIRLEGKVDAFVTSHTLQHTELTALVQKLTTDLVIHTSDNHNAHVAQLREAGLRDEGRRDMLRVIFGTSVVGLVTGIGGLVIAVYKLVEG